MNETKHITEAAGPNGDLSHLGTDSSGKRWEDYDYIKVPLANGKTGIIDVEKLLDDQQRAQTVLGHLIPFLGAFTGKLRTVYTFHVDTQATDGYNLLVNPWFTYNLTLEEKVFVLAHEIMHCVLNHMRRGKGHDPEKSNIAADYECNDTLADEMKIVSPSVLKGLGAYYDKKYDGWGYEKIYADGNCSSQGKSNKPSGSDVEPQGGNSQQNQRGSGSSSKKSQQYSQDFKDGWNQAMEDYKAGKLTI